jgi:hypothetical protein
MLFCLSLLLTFIGLSNFANGSLQHVVQGVETEDYVSGILYSNALSLDSATGYLLVLSYANIVLMVQYITHIGSMCIS